METEPHLAISHKLARLAAKLKDKLYRDSFIAARCRRFLAHQIRSLRGEMSQAEFGKLLDKPQSVVSRLEDPTYGKMTLNSLLEVAAKTDRALLVQFVDWKALLKIVADESEESSAPAPYDQLDVQSFVQAEAIKDAALGLQPIFNVVAPSQNYRLNLNSITVGEWHAAAIRMALISKSMQLKEFDLPENSIEQIVIPPSPQRSKATTLDRPMTIRTMQSVGLSQ